MKNILFALFFITVFMSCSLYNNEDEVTVDVDLEEKVVELNSQLNAWRNLEVENYQFNFRYDCYCANTNEVTITVRADTIFSVVGVQNNSFEYDKSEYRTISGIYDLLLEYADRKPYKFDVQFDIQGHIPLKAFIDFSPNIIDEEMGFRIRYFQK